MNKKFVVESKTCITHLDFATIRNIYQPVIGIAATSLYQLFYDYLELSLKRRTYFLFSDLQKTLGLTFDQVNNEKMKLEAVGLLRTFEKADNNTFIILINKPLLPKDFRDNSLLYKQYISKMGIELFERFEFSNKAMINNKDEFVETTVKYQDMFDISYEKECLTSEFKLPEASNRDEAVISLTPSQFVKFLTNKHIAPSLSRVIRALDKIGFSSTSINYFCSYSFDVNGKIVAKHVDTIANDLFEKNISSSDEIKKELEFALKSRKHKQNPVTEEINSSNNDLEWDDILGTIGDL